MLVAAVLLVSASMRSPISSLGGVLPDIQQDLALPPVLAGLLTGMPPLVFALVGAGVPSLARRLATGRAVTSATILIALGTATRGIGTIGWLISGTAVAMLGIAVANVLLPVVVRSSFPSREGWLTGAYVATMQVGASLGAIATVPVTSATGSWGIGLALWAVPAVVGVAVWTASSRRVSEHGRRDAGDSPLTWDVLARDHVAIALMLMFGLQSTVAYVMMGWLPTILREAGMSPTFAGGMVAVTIAVSIPASFLLPGWLGARNEQHSFVWWVVVPWSAGFVGLMVAPASLPILWASLVGFGLASFPVALLLMGLRSATAADTGRVSAFAQAGGYLLALPGPLFFGVLRDLTGGWTIPLALLLLSMWPFTIYGRRAGRPGCVGTTSM